METLSHKDILALGRAIGELYAARDVESFHERVFSCLSALVPADSASYNDLSFRPFAVTHAVSSSPKQGGIFRKHKDAFNEHIDEHPYHSHAGEGKVFKTTDGTSIGRFRETALFNEYYRHVDIETQLLVPTYLSEEAGGLYALNRKGPDFTERDSLLLALLRLHLMGALRNALEHCRLRQERDLLHKGAEADRRGAILLQSDGTMLCISPFAKEMLERYFDSASEEGDILPGRLLQWFERKGIRGISRKIEREPLAIEGDDRCLKIRLLNDFMTGDYMIVMNERDASDLVKGMEGYGLTCREAEVLCWLAKGKSNPDIAGILGINRRTVEKHVEHIFAKLGVETRTTAVAEVMRKA